MKIEVTLTTEQILDILCADFLKGQEGSRADVLSRSFEDSNPDDPKSSFILTIETHQ